MRIAAVQFSACAMIAAWSVLGPGPWFGQARAQRFLPPSGQAAPVEPPVADAPAEAAPEEQPAKEAGDDEPTPPAAPPEADVRSLEAPLPDVQPSRFNKLLPGTSTVDEMRRQWGEPTSVRDQPGGRAASFGYEIPPFQSVEVQAVGGVVQTIIVHLKQHLAADEIAAMLRLQSLPFAEVADAGGRPLGRVFPERGVMLVFAARSYPPTVAHIVVEPISADMFVLRAEQDAGRHYRQNLASLRAALRLDGEHGRAHWLLARILSDVGYQDEALLNATQAVQLEPQAGEYRLEMARLLNLTGQYLRSIEQTQDALARAELPKELRAVGLVQLGDLRSAGPKPDFKQAMEHYVEAIRTAAPLADDPDRGVRRAARRALVDAHLGMAENIARGPWQSKADVVPMWIRRADALIGEFARGDGAGEADLLSFYKRALAAHVAMGREALDPGPLAANAARVGGGMIAHSNDPLWRDTIRWQVGEALLSAARAYQLRGQLDAALREANSAAAMLEPLVVRRDVSRQRQYLIGELFFLTGSIYAIHHGDHTEAVAWYDKASRLIAEPVPISHLAQLGQYGEWLVSMGISYWETGDRATAVKLTSLGAERIEQAVRERLMPAASLAVPYANLASMHEALGNGQEAQRYGTLAAGHQADGGDTQRR